MKARMEKCRWCEKMYAVKDSSASNRDSYCSIECEETRERACAECGSWYEEIKDAWYAYKDEYDPDEDEGNPRYVDNTVVNCSPNRREYLAFQKQYQKWKVKHCWKESFWAGNGSSGVSFFDGSGGDGGFSFKALLNIVIFCLFIWLGCMGVKCGWNWMFGGGSNEASSAEMMKAWQKHLEQRCEAFEDGLSENEIEAKGLKNYTWDEWQVLKKGTVKAEAASEPGVALVTKKAKEISDTAKSAWQNLTSKKEEDSEAELKRLNARLTELEGEQKAEGQQCTAAPKVEPPKQTADRVKNTTNVPTSNMVSRASKDSKGIITTVHGKGKTKEDALQDAIRRAVWKTIGTWVDSKERMMQNRDEVNSLLRTVTEADVGKYEIVETRQQDGGFVVKAKVAVSKRKIAPKFTKVFPDVFTTK